MSSDKKREKIVRELFQDMWPHYIWDEGHLEDTPKRFLKMLKELTESESFEFTKFDSSSDEMVIVQNIPFYTFCAHHLLPFHGLAHIAYVPSGQLCGISKLARTVKMFSRGLNVQEELTSTIAGYIEEQLSPLGVGVIMEAEHLCMTMRGIEVPGAKTITSSMKGVFLDPKKEARTEFLSLIRSK